MPKIKSRKKKKLSSLVIPRMEEAGYGIDLECDIFLITPGAAQSGKETLLIFCFISSETKPIYFDFRVNY